VLKHRCPARGTLRVGCIAKGNPLLGTQTVDTVLNNIYTSLWCNVDKQFTDSVKKKILSIQIFFDSLSGRIVWFYMNNSSGLPIF